MQNFRIMQNIELLTSTNKKEMKIKLICGKYLAPDRLLVLLAGTVSLQSKISHCNGVFACKICDD